MSEQSKSARAAMRAKANRLANAKGPDKVDASDWSPGSPLNANRKTGARPVRARAYKLGGAIQGDRASPNAGKKPRADGGSTKNLPDKARPDANAKTLIQMGQRKAWMEDPKAQAKSAAARAAADRADRKDGGKVNVADEIVNRDVPKANAEKFGKYHVGGFKKGGAAEKCNGGAMKAGGRTKRAGGGNVTEMPQKGPRPTAYSRKFDEIDRVKKGTPTKDNVVPLKRKSGGRTKGKTNINIVIGQPAAPPAGLQPQVPVRPPTPPMPPPAPPPMAGPPPGAMAGGPPPMGGPGMPPPPMMRRSGGRTIHMQHGAGGGLGRLEKIRKYGKNAHA